MPGPAPKHPSVRARRNNPRAGVVQLPRAVRTMAAPAWPLPPDASRQARLELAEDRVASLVGEIEQAEDGRTKGRLRRNLTQAEQSAAILRLQVEQQADLEAELWRTLWASPQAELWEASAAFERVLAQFVRWNVLGEQGDLHAAKEARLRGREFGLTPATLLSLKAEIERVDEAETRGSSRRGGAPARKPAAKKRAGGDPRDALYDAG